MRPTVLEVGVVGGRADAGANAGDGRGAEQACFERCGALGGTFDRGSRRQFDVDGEHALAHLRQQRDAEAAASPSAGNGEERGDRKDGGGPAQRGGEDRAVACRGRIVATVEEVGEGAEEQAHGA